MSTENVVFDNKFMTKKSLIKPSLKPVVIQIEDKFPLKNGNLF